MIKIQSYFGKDIEQHLEKVAEWRLKHFLEYPYLYVGSLELERSYLAGMIDDSKAMLFLATDEKKQLVAVSTGIPLMSNADIVADAQYKLKEFGHKTEHFYYFGEIIVSKEFRGKGVSKLIFEAQERTASGWGFSSVCLAVVVRNQDEPRRPKNYLDTDKVWSGLGYKKTNIEFEYKWPTIQHDGSVKEESNKMLFWTKQLVKA